MNIKVVYSTRTHKISAKHQTLSDLRNAVLALYPEQLQQGFHLFITLSPQCDPLKVFDEQHFARIKEVYKQMQWQTMKFLVKDFAHPELSQEDFNILNQSIIVNSNIQMPNVDDLYHAEKKQQEFTAKLEIQPKAQIQKEEQQKQIKRDELPIPKKEQTEQQEAFVQEVIKQLNNVSLQDVDYNSEEFKKFVVEQIDDRLVFHKLIRKDQAQPQPQQKQQQPQPQQQQKPLYKMSLLYKQHNEIQMMAGTGQQWQIHVKNEGVVTWRIGFVKLIGICGVYKDLLIDLQHDVEPNGVGLFSVYLIPPNQVMKNQTQEFKMAFVENNKKEFFGQKVCFCLTIVNNQLLGKSTTITQKDADLKVQVNQGQMIKIKQFIDYTGASEQDAIKFVQIFEPNTDLQEIIGTYLDQQK